MHRRLLALSLLALAALAPRAAAAEVVNKILLRINDRIVTQRDYELARDDLKRDISRRTLDADEKERQLAESGEVVFKNLYEDLLLQSRADQLNVTIAEQEVDGAVQQMRESFNIQNDEQFKAALAQTGMTEKELRENLRKNLRVRELVGREVQAKIKLGEDDLRRYYQKNVDLYRVPEQVHLREAVILADKVPSGEERQRLAREIRAAVVGGKTLDEAVKAQKEAGASSGVSDLGWVPRTDLDAGIAQVSWDLAPGAISEPTEGRGGTHLLQMVERRPSYVRPFTEVSSEIDASERNRLFRDRFAQYEQELEKDSLIVAHPPDEAVGYRRLIGTPPADPLESADAPGALVPAPGAAAPAAVSPSPAPPPLPPVPVPGRPSPEATTPPPPEKPPV
ncbi:MAG TPA: peptidyl-prolyl cis-trans isomerase [Thermoanaerobaculia bacterium]|nr:peptidyl-prolyl cis-trans isomerase [Thermoanaerobaculia bacterium]